MPRYFFHLSFGDRTCCDEEGIEFPNRAAARAEAFAVLRDLGRGRTEENGRAWAGWVLHVADAASTFFSLPIDPPPLAVAAHKSRSKSTVHRRLTGRLAALARRMLEIRQRTVDLMREHRKLRDELASEFRRCAQIRSDSRGLLASTRSARLEAAGVSDLCLAMRPPRRSPPHLVLVPGGPGGGE